MKKKPPSVALCRVKVVCIVVRVFRHPINLNISTVVQSILVFSLKKQFQKKKINNGNLQRY